MAKLLLMRPADGDQSRPEHIAKEGAEECLCGKATAGLVPAPHWRKRAITDIWPVACTPCYSFGKTPL